MTLFKPSELTKLSFLISTANCMRQDRVRHFPTLAKTELTLDKGLVYMDKMNHVRNKLQYVSDLHIEKGYQRHIYAKRPYLLLGGDIGYVKEPGYKNFLRDVSYSFDKVFLLSGNHEYDGYRVGNFHKVEEKIKNICSMSSNIFYLQKDIHKLCDDYNIYIAGCTLWSTLPRSRLDFHYDHVEWLKSTLLENEDKTFVVATHHAPSFKCLNTSLNSYVPNYFATDQIELIKMKNMLCWIFGHTHINKDIILETKHILSNQYGSFQDPLYGYK